MPQYRAAAFLESIRNILVAEQESTSSEHPDIVSGLIDHLSLFEVEGLQTLPKGHGRDSILSVAYNIVCRGIPTIATPQTEQLLADCLGLTLISNGQVSITYSLSQEGIETLTAQKLIDALHLIVPREQARSLVVSRSQLDSQFEIAFIESLIPEEHGYLRQLFARQRPRNTLGAPAGNEGRADFAIEIPYSLVRSAENKYKEEVSIRYKENFIVEVDGERYHRIELDHAKDFALARLNNNITHVREQAAHGDTQAFINSIQGNHFIESIRSTFNGSRRIDTNVYLTVLVPTAMVRIQVTILEWLQTIVDRNRKYKIAILEQDVPGARWAFNELIKLLHNLNSISSHPTTLPNFELDVYTNNWLGTTISTSERSITEFANNNYDLVIDLSVLQRKDVFNGTVNVSNLVTIRTSHFTQRELNEHVQSAKPITYKSPAASNNGKKAVVSSLEYLLGILFRKREFREGQLPILARALQRKSVIGLLPTGGGKSLTFQLAAMLQPGITIVVDPIRSLMVDQHRGLVRNGITKSVFINSVLSSEEKRHNQKEMSKGLAQFVFISPERMVIDEFRHALSATSANGHHFSFCVIDEVHCLSEWGHDFRTPYLNLGDNARRFCKTEDSSLIPIIGLTATASFDVLADIERELKIDREDGDAVVRYENTVRNEIFFRVQEVNAEIISDEMLSASQIRERIATAKRPELANSVLKKSKAISELNSQALLQGTLKRAFEEYVPDTHKPERLTDYTNLQLKKLLFPHSINLCARDGKYNHGIVVFAPHRHGNYGVYDLFTDEQAGWITDNSVGYFMGAGDDEKNDADEIDHTAASMRYMDEFLRDELSIMFATKAFGMGIDKPNVRLTYHLNMSSSIESFVQEAGRAARDGKVSVSTIYFNNQKFSQVGDQDRYKLDPFGEYLPDLEILSFFHRLSFEGCIKENVILDELLTSILYPLVPMTERLAKELGAMLNIPSIRLTAYEKPGARRIYISTSETDIGYVSVSANGLFANDVQHGCEQLVQGIIGHLYGLSGVTGPDQLWTILKETTILSLPSEGLENRLKDAQIDEKVQIDIPFHNRYYPIWDKNLRARIISQELREKILSCSIVRQLDAEGIYQKQAFDIRLTAALNTNKSFHDFVESFTNQQGGLRARLHANKELEETYSLPRNERHTAKAIYRLTVLGIADSYTIDYQNKRFSVHCTKKADGFCFEALEKLMARYTSSATASAEKRKHQREFESLREQNSELTEIRFCLTKLTEFVYEKIEEKRRLAMSDMVSLCQRAILDIDPISQSESIKSEIFYYFNAKYSRENNEVVLINEQGNEVRLPACLPKELNSKEPVEIIVEKYLRFVEDDTTGAFRNNLKHLRGAAQRTITSFPDFSVPYFLRAYCLLIQSEDVPSLTNDAVKDILAGLAKIEAGLGSKSIVSLLTTLQERAKEHYTSRSIDDAFEELEDQYYAGYHAQWITNFSDNFLNKT